MKIVVIGAGISGLVAAWYLRGKGEVTVLEAGGRAGGWIETKEVNGFSFETGPRTFQRGKCPLLLELVQEVGLEPIFAGSGTRYLWHDGKMRSMQSFWPQLLWAVCKDIFSSKRPAEDETIYDFACRRCGKTAADLFFDPLAKGVFGGDIKQLSVRSCFPSLYHAKSLRKLKQKDQGLFSVRGGMEKLVEVLAANVVLHCPAEEIREDGVVAGGKLWPADLIVVALPGAEVARLCGVPLQLRNESLSVVNLGYHGDLLPFKGYGYLVPTRECEKILGQIWDSNLFPTTGQTKVTAMVRGADPEGIAIDAMARHLGITQKPAAIHVRQAQIPQYDLYHHKRIAEFEEAVKSRFDGKVLLTGNYLEGASVESCLRRSKFFS